MTTVMIVDDDHVTTSLLETLLDLDGFNVVVARRGADVLPKIKAGRPDVIMMDYHLTDMEGVDIIRELRAHPEYHNIPIVMASGMDVSDEAFDAGANEFILKPFEPAELPDLFNRLIAG